MTDSWCKPIRSKNGFVVSGGAARNVRIATAGGAPPRHAATSVVAPVAVSASVAASDAATPTRSTTLGSCRQKRIRRHQATRWVPLACRQ